MVEKAVQPLIVPIEAGSKLHKSISGKTFKGRTGVWLATAAIDAQDQKAPGSTFLNVDVDLTPDDLDSYDSGRYVEEIDGYRTFHVPSRLLDHKVFITRGGDVAELPSNFDVMSDPEIEA